MIFLEIMPLTTYSLMSTRGCISEIIVYAGDMVTYKCFLDVSLGFDYSFGNLSVIFSLRTIIDACLFRYQEWS